MSKKVWHGKRTAREDDRVRERPIARRSAPARNSRPHVPIELPRLEVLNVYIPDHWRHADATPLDSTEITMGDSLVPRTKSLS